MSLKNPFSDKNNINDSNNNSNNNNNNNKNSIITIITIITWKKCNKIVLFFKYNWNHKKYVDLLFYNSVFSLKVKGTLIYI